MKISGFGPETPAPYVAKWVEVGGERISKHGMPVDPDSDDKIVQCEMELLPGEWPGVLHDGTAVAFPLASEASWRVLTAQNGVTALEGAVDPKSRLDGLLACAELVNVDAVRLTKTLEGVRLPGEPMHEAWARTRPKG